MLAGDILVAADNSRFCQMEAKRGIAPLGGAHFRFITRAGWGDAMYHLCCAMNSRPARRIDWTPQALSAFLDWFLSEMVGPPYSIVAAGHAAGYALQHAASKPGTIERLALIAPTWRGPFPTMMGGQRPWFASVRSVVDHRGIGPLLYRLNVSRFVVAKMRKSTSTAIPIG